MTTINAIRPQGKWFVRQLVAKTGQREADAEAAILELIERGHLKIIYGEGPRGCDLFEVVIERSPC